MFKSKVMQLWHPESPGVRVYVRRKWWQRLFLKERFAYLGERTLLPHQMVDVRIEAIKMAVVFHDTYEQHAPLFGYETRTDTKTFDPTSPNGRLMTAVCMHWLTGGHLLTTDEI